MIATSVVILVFWVFGFISACVLEFGLVYFMMSIIFLIFQNLRKESSPDGISAYSVFNKGGRRLAGEYDPRDYDDHIRRGGHAAGMSHGGIERDKNLLKAGEILHEKVQLQRRSKFANQICPCGSTRKYKKCCGLINPNEKKEIEEWEKEWT